ncbi:MAG TPA: ABC transporter permease [Acidimicrobiales bacterium]|nr:ABC transporter permease [Acidimicrobiales bacterium]
MSAVTVPSVVPDEGEGVGVAARLRSRVARGRGALRGRGYLVWVFVLLVIAAFAVFGDLLAPIDPALQAPRDRLLGPMSSTDSGLHVFGTDQLGRDLFGRVIVGTRLTVVIALASMVAGSLVGTAAGLVAGFYGGPVDRLVSRVAEAQTAMPMFLIAILLVSLVGASVVNLVIVLPTLVWPSFARIVRAETLRLRQAGFMEAAVVVGGSNGWIMGRHLLPNLATRIVTLTVVSTGQVILAEAGLSFLGAGVQAPDTTWGLLVSTGREYLAVAWWLTIVPGVFLVLTVLALNMLGRRYTDDRGAAA